MSKPILKIAGFLGRVAMAILIAVVAFCVGRDYQYRHPTRDPLDTLPSIQQVQRRIGATIDGKLGTETQRLWDKQYCQQAAEWSVANMPKEKK
jgi:hypothetical protein